jgi:KDO2-lipid IV(A) lauroyltransferase
MDWLFRLLAMLPLGVLHSLGVCLGWAVFLLSPTYRRHVRDNMAQAGIPTSLLPAAIAAAGKMAAELPWVWLAGSKRRLASIRWDGLELIESSLALGRGLVYLTPHMGCFEILPPAHAHWIAPRFGPITILYRRPRAVAMERIVRAARAVPGVHAVPVSTAGVRALFRVLKHGGAVGLLPDQVPEPGLGVWAPFFGRPAYSMTLAVRLARRANAPMLMVFGERLSWGRGYVVHVRKFALPRDVDDEVAVGLMNRQLEELIRCDPAMYLWGYARYKQPTRKTGGDS